MTGVFIIREKYHVKTAAQRETCEDREIGMRHLQVRGCPRIPATRSIKNRFSQRQQSERGPTNTLILDLQTLNFHDFEPN